MIIHKFVGRVLLTNDTRVNKKVDVTLSWDEEHDPLAVQAFFETHIDTDEEDEDELEDSVTWTFGRELLYRGVNSHAPVGQGDIKIRYEGVALASVLLCLKTPEGHADIRLPHGEVYSFLTQTFKVCPIGSESLDAGVDDLLADIFRKDAA